jgi:chitodextrinase
MAIVCLLAVLVVVLTFGAGAGAAGPAGLVAAYGFDEGSGSSVADASGNGNTGSISGATWTAGKFGNALSFNGSTSRVTVADSASLHLSGAMTLEAWVKPNVTTNSWRDVIYKGNDNYYLMAATTSSSRPAGGGTFGGANGNVFGAAALPVGSWAHIAVTYDGSALRFFLNGSQAGSTVKTGAISSSTNPLSIGSDSIFGQYFNGAIDEARVYSTALTAAQITTDMGTAVGGGGSADTQPPSAPGTLTASAASSSQVNLSWGAASDNVGVTSYLVERCQGSGCSDFAQVGTSASTSFSDSSLAASTSYSYRVRASDGASNLSPYSNVASATTQAGSTSPGLVAAYGFEEGSGFSVADASGNGNTGTISSATWTTAGRFGNALNFNGTSSRVAIPDAASLHLSTGMTLEAWVDPNAIPNGWRDVIYKGNDNYYLMAATSNAKLPAGGGIFGGSNANAFGSSALQTGTWSYLAVTYDGSTLRFYVNGTQVGSTSKTGAITTSTNPLSIGSDSIYGQYFNGLIDEVRIYNTPLPLAQIQSDMGAAVVGSGPPDAQPPSAPGTLTATAAGSSQINLTWGASTDNVGVTGYRIDRCTGVGCNGFSHLVQIVPPVLNYSDTGLAAGTTYNYQVRAMDAAGNLGPVSNSAGATTQTSALPNLVAAYGFEEGSGSTVADASGNGNTGTISGATWTTAGRFGNALNFNGTSSRVTIPDAGSLHLTGGMTLEAWVNPNDVPSRWRDVVYKGNDNYYLMASTSTASRPAGGGTFGGSNANVFGATPVSTGAWTHIAVTYDGTTLRFYANGTQVGSTTKSGAVTTSTNPLSIGSDSIYGQYFNGTIDEVRVYDAALTATQIQADMVQPVALPTPPSNLTATVASSTQINLAWGASTDAAGVTGYRVERCQGPGCINFAQIATPAGTSYNDTGLTANTNYSYRVRAVDAAGKLGPYSNVATGFTGLLVAPRAVALTPGQTQQYSATIPGSGNPTVTWSVDGTTGGSSSVGTITSGGLYTAPSTVVSHTISATTTDQTASGSATAYTTSYAGNFTFHNDNMRTGQNLSETVLTPANVNSSSFGKLFTYPLDGQAVASPLYVQGVAVPGQGTRNIVYFATEHDGLYAYDATTGSSTPLWKRSFIDPASGVTTVPAADVGECCDIAPEIGITSTPVIDPSTNTMYVVAKTKEVSGSTTTYVQRLHALDIATGAEKFGGPVVIQASVPGTGNGAVNGQVPFDPLHENQRAALTLLNGTVYMAFSSHGDIQPYHGWVLGYNASTLQRTVVWNATPNDEGAGIWGVGGALAADGTNLFFVTGDGEFTANTGGSSYGDSFVRMTPGGSVLDYFSPFNQANLNAANHDLGAGGTLLLPDQPGAHPHEMVSAGKDGSIMLVDRDNMGHYNGTSNTNVQTLSNIFPNGSPEPGNFSAPVYWNGYVFFGPLGDTVDGFKLTNGLLSTSPTFRSAITFPDRGAALAISGNGPTSNGILWAVQRNGTTSPGVVHAYDPANSTNGVLKELYSSSQAGTRDTDGIASKFTIPLVANGKVFVAGYESVSVYGLLP